MKMQGLLFIACCVWFVVLMIGFGTALNRLREPHPRIVPMPTEKDDQVSAGILFVTLCLFALLLARAYFQH